MNFLTFCLLTFFINLGTLRANTQLSEDWYISAHCGIYDKNQKLIFKDARFVLCDYANNGYYVATNSDNTFALLNYEQQILWQSKEYIHHDLKFSKDETEIIAILGENFIYEQKKVKSDCVVVKDLNNNIKKKWCVSQNLSKLKDLGFNFDPLETIDIQSSLVPAGQELSHLNSVYEIEENRHSNYSQAFQTGNYILYLGRPSCALIILDSKLQNILWYKNFCQMNKYFGEIDTYLHDTQITAQGTILAYVNFIVSSQCSFCLVPENIKTETFFEMLSKTTQFQYTFFNTATQTAFYPDLRSMLVEIDPFTEMVSWSYADFSTNSFFSELHGTLTKTSTGTLLYTDYGSVRTQSQMYEIDLEGHRLWSMEMPESTDSGKSIRIREARPLEKKNGFIRLLNTTL